MWAKYPKDTETGNKHYTILQYTVYIYVLNDNQMLREVGPKHTSRPHYHQNDKKNKIFKQGIGIAEKSQEKEGLLGWVM